MVEDDERDLRWRRIEFYPLSAQEGQSFGTCTPWSAFDVPGDLTPFSLAPCPPLEDSSVGQDAMIILCVSDFDEGVAIIYDYKRGVVVSQRRYGTGVTTVNYSDGVIVTGHQEHTIRVWDLETGTPLVEVGCGGGAVLGIGAMGEPEGWIGKPEGRGRRIVSFADVGDGGSEFCVWDLEGAVRTAMARVKGPSAKGRTVSLPPISLQPSQPLMKRVKVDIGEDVASFAVWNPCLVVVGVDGRVGSYEIETGKEIVAGLDGAVASCPGTPVFRGLGTGFDVHGIIRVGGQVLICTSSGIGRVEVKI